MQSVNLLDLSSEDSREITEPEKIKEILEQALKFDWKFDYLVMTGKKVTSLPADLTSVNEIPDVLTIVGDFSSLSSNETKNVYFRANNGGLSVVFQSELIDCTDFFTQKECRFYLPESLRFSQLRSAVRINFSNLHDIPVTFHASVDNFFTGKVVDMSETGAKIKFVGNVQEHVDIAEVVADCRLILPGDSIIEARVQVMGCLYDSTADISYVRCRFLELDSNCELQLRQFIYQALAQLQKEQKAV